MTECPSICPFKGCPDCRYRGGSDPVAAQAVSSARQCDIQSNRWDNGNGPSRCVNTDQGLTRSSGTSREGMASMIATQAHESRRNLTDRLVR